MLMVYNFSLLAGNFGLSADSYSQLTIIVYWWVE